MSDFFKELEAKIKLGHSEIDPPEHVLSVFSEFDRFRKAITKSEIKSRREIMDALSACVHLLHLKTLQLPANVENDIKQFTLRLSTIEKMIGRKDGVYKLADLKNDVTDSAKGKLLFIEQRIKNNVRMYREGTGQPPITDADRSKMQKHYSVESKLPDRIATPFAVVESNVVPLFEDFNAVSDKVLKLVGIDYDRIADSFVVLKRQKLLAADIPKLIEMFGEGRRNTIYLHSIIMDVLEQINKNSAIKYELMSSSLVSNPKNANIKFAWLIPATKLKDMSRFTRTVRLQSWSLPHRHMASL